MDDQLARAYERWQQAEARGADDAADAAFESVFRTAMSTPAVSPGFTARTVDAIAAAAARDRERTRRMRTIVVPAAIGAGVVALYFSAGLIASGLTTAVVWLLNLVIGAVVATATAVQSGPDGWTIMSSLGRAAAAVISNPAVTVTIFAIQGFAITALIVLRRLLGSDRESFR